MKRAKLYRQVAQLETANEIFSFGILKVTDPHLRERWTTIFYELLRGLEQADPGADQPGPGEDQAGPGEDPPVAAEQPARASFKKPLSTKRKHISIELD